MIQNLHWGKQLQGLKIGEELGQVRVLVTGIFRQQYRPDFGGALLEKFPSVLRGCRDSRQVWVASSGSYVV
jgi:hypothetical protein